MMELDDSEHPTVTTIIWCDMYSDEEVTITPCAARVTHESHSRDIHTGAAALSRHS